MSTKEGPSPRQASATDHYELLSVEAVAPASNSTFGTLTMITDKGPIFVAINHDTAFALIEKIVDFLDPDEKSPATS